VINKIFTLKLIIHRILCGYKSAYSPQEGLVIVVAFYQSFIHQHHWINRKPPCAYQKL